MRLLYFSLRLCLLIFLFTLHVSAEDVDRVLALQNAETWMYQIQDLDEPGAISALAETDYPLLVLEPTYTNDGDEDFDVEAMLETLRYTPQGVRRLLIAYIDIGEAEDYRYYWKRRWRAPTENRRGRPRIQNRELCRGRRLLSGSRDQGPRPTERHCKSLLPARTTGKR